MPRLIINSFETSDRGETILLHFGIVTSAANVVPGISDHDAVLFEVDQSLKYLSKPKRKIYQFHKKKNFEKLKENLNNLKTKYLSSSPQLKSVNENWEFFSRILKQK